MLTKELISLSVKTAEAPKPSSLFFTSARSDLHILTSQYYMTKQALKSLKTQDLSKAIYHVHSQHFFDRIFHVVIMLCCKDNTMEINNRIDTQSTS